MKNKQLIIPSVLLGIFVLMAVFAPFIVQDPYYADPVNKFAPSSWNHFLGTDHLGRDVFARLIYGIRLSLLSVLAISLLILISSVFVGTYAGYRGGVFDTILMRVCDIFLTFPTFVLALFLIGIMGSGLLNVIIAIALTHWAWYARIVRGLVLDFKSRGYVSASIASGASHFQVIIRHILPSVLIQVLILSSLDLGHMMLHVAGLSFLGIGVQPPLPEWGVMLYDSTAYVYEHPLLMVYPGLFIFISVILFNSIGEAFRDKLDPALKGEL